MQLIIDGNNLIGFSHISLNDNSARQQLIDLLLVYQDFNKVEITLVFDGQPRESDIYRSGKIRVLFPEYGESADDKIQEILKSSLSLRGAKLITSDKELAEFAISRGVKTKTSRAFYKLLKKTVLNNKKKEDYGSQVNLSLNNMEIDRWLKIFEEN